MKTRITNYFGSINLGDEAMLRGILELVGPDSQDSACSIISLFSSDLDRSRFPDIPVLPQICKSQSRNKLLRPSVAGWNLLFGWLSAHAPLFGRLVVGAAARESLKDLKNTDRVVMTGGPFLKEGTAKSLLGISFARPDYFLPLTEIFLALAYRKPVFVLGQGVGQFESPIGRYVLRKILSRVRVITARDRKSASILKDPIGLDRNLVHYLPDLCFLNPANSTATLEEAAPSLVGVDYACINVRALGPESTRVLIKRWNLDAEGVTIRYRELFSSLVRHLSRKTGLRVCFVSQQVRSDIVMSEAIWKQSDQQQGAIFLDGLSLSQYFSVIKNAKLVVSTRYHTALFAVHLGAPVLAFDYMPKISNALHDLGAGDTLWSSDGTFDEEKVNSAIQKQHTCFRRPGSMEPSKLRNDYWQLLNPKGSKDREVSETGQ